MLFYLHYLPKQRRRKKFLKIIFRNEVHIAPVRKKQIKSLLSFEVTIMPKIHKSGLKKSLFIALKQLPSPYTCRSRKREEEGRK